MSSMTEMPFHLRTLSPEALDVLRFFGRTDTTAEYGSNAIISGSGLSERGFRKGLRRLVNKKLVTMTSDEVYRLTDAGRSAVADLIEWDLTAPDRPAVEARYVSRRVYAAAPRTLVSGQPAALLIGFDEADDEDVLADPVDLMIRVTVLDGTVENALTTEKAYRLSNYAGRQTFEISGGQYNRARVRIEIMQIENEGEEPGGMYFDLPVAAEPEGGDSTFVGYSSTYLIRAE